MARRRHQEYIGNPFSLANLRQAIRKATPWLLLLAAVAGYGVYWFLSDLPEIEDHLLLEDREFLTEEELSECEVYPARYDKIDHALLPTALELGGKPFGFGVYDYDQRRTLAGFKGDGLYPVFWLLSPSRNELIFVETGLASPGYQRIRGRTESLAMILPSKHQSRIYRYSLSSHELVNKIDIPFPIVDPKVSSDGSQLLASAAVGAIEREYSWVAGSTSGESIALEDTNDDETQPVLVDLEDNSFQRIPIRHMSTWFETEDILIIVRREGVLRHHVGQGTTEALMVFSDDWIRYLNTAQLHPDTGNITFLVQTGCNCIHDKTEFIFELFEIATDGSAQVRRSPLALSRNTLVYPFRYRDSIRFNLSRGLSTGFFSDDPWVGTNKAEGLFDLNTGKILAAVETPSFVEDNLKFVGADHIAVTTYEGNKAAGSRIIPIEEFIASFPPEKIEWIEDMEDE